MKTNWKTQYIENRESKFLNLVEKIDKNKNKPTRHNGTIETMLLEFFGKTSKHRYTWKRATFKRLLIHVYNQKCYALLRDYKSVEVLHNISAFGNQIVSNIEDWKSKDFSKELQLKSLIRHCFTIYETPAFLENSFFRSDKKHMLWYIQLAKGKSAKALSRMPISLTSKMAYEFVNAPEIFEVNEALRFAQALGFGASHKVARIIGFSNLSEIRKNEENFWVTVVSFFAKETELAAEELDEILKYLVFRYNENESFSMKDRTKKALLIQAKEWLRNVYRDEIGDILTWETSGITPLYVKEFEKGKTIVYKTVELLNSIELYDEGIEMHHCIAEYDEDCKDGRSTVFSLRKEVEGETTKSLVTIEVGLDEKIIFEAKAKHNTEPSTKYLELIDLWIKNSEVKRNVEIAYPEQFNGGVINNINNDNDTEYNVVMIIKVVFWILYFISRAIMSNK